LEVSRIARKEANDFLSRFHYLGGVRGGAISFGLINENILFGVVCFNKIHMAGMNAMELTRLVLADGLPKNSASKFLAKCLRRINVEVVVTFADEDAGHIGKVYQACNAFYLGKVGETIAYEVDGLIYSGKFIEKKIRGFLDDGKAIKLIKAKGKHKYVFITVGDKKRNRELKLCFERKSKPYPGLN
jgi:hypothetical protein